MDNQSIGLAERMGLPVTQKFVEPIAPWKHIPPWLWMHGMEQYGAKSSAFEPPWPDVLIGTSRQTIAASFAVKKLSGGKTFCIRIQDPKISFKHFDVVIAPAHDRIRGDNVIQTVGAMHFVTPQKLQSAAQQSQYAHLPSPKIAVLVGGNNKHFRLDEAAATQLTECLVAMAKKNGGSLLVTTSRRTGQAATQILQQGLRDTPGVVWTGEGANPYFEFLGLADAVVATGDSVSMTCEACITGKPVYTVDLRGGSVKFSRFHQLMQAQGYTRPFLGELEDWSGAQLDEVSDVAAEVWRRMGSGE